MQIRNPKDFWTGLLFLALGLTAVALARNYPLGTTFKMGPGYFPTILGALLAVVGLAALGRSLVRPGTPVAHLHLRPLALVLVATVLFGVLVRNAGLVAAVPALVIVSARASTHFRWHTALLYAAGLTLLSWLLFVVGLGLPIPLIGPWLGG